MTPNAAGRLVRTPAANINGDDRFICPVADALGGTTTAAVRVAVAPVNDAPTAVDDAYGTGFGEALSVDAAAGLQANDSDLDGDARRVVGFSTATKGALNVLEAGSFTYTPDAGQSGEDVIT